MLKSLKTTPGCSPGHQPEGSALPAPTSPLGFQVTFPGPLTPPCHTLLGAGFSLNAGMAMGEAGQAHATSTAADRAGTPCTLVCCSDPAVQTSRTAAWKTGLLTAECKMPKMLDFLLCVQTQNMKEIQTFCHEQLHFFKLFQHQCIS